MAFRTVKGMHDILPLEGVGEMPPIASWQRLEDAFRTSAELHGYSEVRTPLLEQHSLFVRSIGETTDVVEKEMYVVRRGDDQLALRPEGTASAARAYVQHKVTAKQPVTRWYYLGPMYRAERPQRGRYRQFYQAGCEIYGDPGPACDAELIDMLVGLFRGLGFEDLEVCVNSLGSGDTRARYRQRLLEFLRPHASELSDDSQRRLERNPFRVLDSKAKVDQEIVKDAPQILDVLDEADQSHWDGLRRLLDSLEVPYTVDSRLVRGLDYYTRTLFEVKSNAGNLGAQNTLCGGGRYDNMIKSLGGGNVPAIGFAMGLERILLALDAPPPELEPNVFFAPLGEAALPCAMKLARQLRAVGIAAQVDGRGNSMKSMLRRANAEQARLVVILGEKEMDSGVAQLKDFAKHSEEQVSQDALLPLVRERL